MSFAVKSRLAVGAARIGAHRLREKVLRSSRPIAPGELPSSAEAITTGWLTHLLCAGHPGTEVVDVAVTPGSDGTSARRGLTVTYNVAGAAAGLPTALYAKSTPDLQTRLMCGLSGIGAAEANFYTVLRPALGIDLRTATTPATTSGTAGRCSSSTTSRSPGARRSPIPGPLTSTGPWPRAWSG